MVEAVTRSQLGAGCVTPPTLARENFSDSLELRKPSWLGDQ